MLDMVERKKRFAQALLECEEMPYKAALVTFPEKELLGIGMQVASEWASDPYVLTEKARLLGNSGGTDFLPSKAQQARDIYAIATATTNSPEDRIKAHRLYAEMQNFIDKGAGALNILNQGVMIVRSQGSDEEWEKKTTEQQRTLTGDSSAIH